MPPSKSKTLQYTTKLINSGQMIGIIRYVKETKVSGDELERELRERAGIYLIEDGNATDEKLDEIMNGINWELVASQVSYLASKN